MECELLPCGHCKSAMVDDQCGRPEHRYCGACREGECNETWEEDFGKMMDDRDAIKTKLDAALLQVRELRRAIGAVINSSDYEADDRPLMRDLRAAVSGNPPEVCGRVLPTNVRCDESIPCPHHGREFAEKRKCVRCGHDVPCPEHNKGL